MAGLAEVLGRFPADALPEVLCRETADELATSSSSVPSGGTYGWSFGSCILCRAILTLKRSGYGKNVRDNFDQDRFCDLVCDLPGQTDLPGQIAIKKIPIKHGREKRTQLHGDNVGVMTEK